MSAIVQTLLNVFGRFFDFLRFLWGVLGFWIQATWGAFSQVVGAVLGVFADVFYYIVSAITDVLLFIMQVSLAILPPMPHGAPTPGAFDLGMANRYVPFSEVAALTGIWVVICGSIGAYKFAKIVRGGG